MLMACKYEGDKSGIWEISVIPEKQALTNKISKQ